MFLIDRSSYEIRAIGRKGKGVFARREIPAGTIVGDYLGRIVSDKEAARLEKKLGGHYYSFEYIGRNKSIFPVDCQAPGVHLINHSCAPNCATTDIKGHNVYYALRHIFKGEELTVDYEFDPESDGGPAPCFCDSPFCRGTMHARMKKPTIARKSALGHKQKKKGGFQDKPGKYQVVPIGEFLPPLAKYPANIPDSVQRNGQVNDLYANLNVAPLTCPESVLPKLSELRRRLRTSGRPLRFAKLNLTILGAADNHLVAKR